MNADELAAILAVLTVTAGSRLSAPCILPESDNALGMEKMMKTVRRLSRRSREIFLDGLRRYQDKGVRILVDGKDAMPEDMERLLVEYEDGSFYMGDYIWEESRQGAAAVKENGAQSSFKGDRQRAALAREHQAVYQAAQEAQQDPAAGGQSPAAVTADNLGGKRLKEIHFDRVYYR